MYWITFEIPAISDPYFIDVIVYHFRDIARAYFRDLIICHFRDNDIPLFVVDLLVGATKNTHGHAK